MAFQQATFDVGSLKKELNFALVWTVSLEKFQKAKISLNISSIKKSYK